MGLFLIRFMWLFALALWVGGGAAVAFLAAPAVFARAGSRRRAGEIVGAILRRLDLTVLVLAPFALAGPVLEAVWTGQALGSVAVPLGLVGGMTALGLFSRLALTPRIARLRDELGDDLDRVPKEDPRRRAFGKLHGFSVLCLLGQLLLGTVAIAVAVLRFGGGAG
jgi:uncharacterized membrane protein